MKYWDSSAIMPLLLLEQSSAAMKDVFSRDRTVFAWWAAEVECVSALARVERERRLNPDDLAFAYRRLQVFCASWYVIQPNEALKEITNATRQGERSDGA
jgi:predicted nucleic acid-binding protein